jgi:hypothetical protein
MLKPRASSQYRSLMGSRLKRNRVAKSLDKDAHDGNRLPKLQDEARVKDVLACGAPVHKAGGLNIGGRNLLGKCRDERYRKIACDSPCILNTSQVIKFSVASSDNAQRRLLRNDA